MKIKNSREEAKEKLISFMQNPGYFSILILGDAGTGKEYLIRKIIKENEKICICYPFEIGATKEDISKIFENDFIVIKNIEELSYIQQDFIYKALSTTDGKIGLSENRGYKRIIFTSSYNIENLRDSKEYLKDKFWDRIAQLIVKIPSFKDYSADIKKDFESVWKKMKFNEFPKLPDDTEFLYWLKENCGTFAGNFRDLDKIAILWHQYRIIEYKKMKQKYKVDIEARIFRKVRADFEKFTHFPSQKSDSSNTFEFEKGKSWEQIERNFKSKFKSWAKKEYKTIKQATQELNMPLRKMDKW